MDDVFRALSDPSRRRMLDLLKEKPGLNVNQLTEHFEFSRYGVMKHLKILEKAGLVVARQSGRFKLCYLNVIPLQMISDRWMSRFSSQIAPSLTRLKHHLESEEKEMAHSKAELKHVFVVYIQTSRDKLWDALTRPEMTSQYYFNSALRGDLAPGSPIDFVLQDEQGRERVPVKGQVSELVPRQRLVYTFQFTDREDPPSRVAYDIEEERGLLKLTVTHDEFEGETSTYQEVSSGWPYILSGLKTLLETGRPLTGG